ncbi:hypothetical protein LINPERHAP1_LOCUS27616 [Linum perenne]
MVRLRLWTICRKEAFNWQTGVFSALQIWSLSITSSFVVSSRSGFGIGLVQLFPFSDLAGKTLRASSWNGKM